MTETETLHPGDVVTKHPGRSIADPMACYIFDGWSDTLPSPIGGRVATLTWCYNGHASSAWESDLTFVGRCQCKADAPMHDDARCPVWLTI